MSDFSNPETSTTKQGVKIQRRFTKVGESPFDSVRWDKRVSKIRDESGKAIFEKNDAEVPSVWSQVATDIIVSKYFRRAGVPQFDEKGQPIIGADGKQVTGSEGSAKQVIKRLTNCWRFWGEKYGFFASQEDAKAFEEELQYMLVHQMTAPNSPQWFNTGLALSYGITGPSQGHHYVDPDDGILKESSDAYSRPQTSACFIQSVKDSLLEKGGIMDLVMREARIFKYGSGTGTNFSTIREEGAKLSGGGASSGLMSWLRIFDRAAGAIKSGGTTRRAAKMVILNIDHPDVEQFIWWKANEEKKVSALVAAGYPSDFNGEAYQTVSGQNSNNTVRVTNEFLDAVEKDGEWNLISRIPGRGIVKTLKARKLWLDIAQTAWQSADPGLQYDTTIQEWHTCPASGRINATNPCCITGDTLIAVADGKNAVPIKELAGKETPVYTWDLAKKQVVVGKMHNIGIKREKAEIFRVTLDDGSSFRATNDHLIMLKDGAYRQVKDLQTGDSLMPFHSKIRQIADSRTPRRYIHSGKGWRAQYRWLWENTFGKQPSGFHIHHKNLNSFDDRLENLALISEEEHKNIHREHMLGDNNPAHRMMNEEWRKNLSLATSGEKNPHYGVPQSEETKQKMHEAAEQRWNNPAQRIQASNAASNWILKAKEAGKHVGRNPRERFVKCCPVCRNNFDSAREGQIFCSMSCRISPLGYQMSGAKHGEAIKGTHLSAERKEKLRLSGIAVADPEQKRAAQKESLRIRCVKAVRFAIKAGIKIDLKNWNQNRETIRQNGVKHVPSAKTIQEFYSSEDKLIEDAQLWNHNVVSVQAEGREDVYDGTVDSHHNFGIITSRVPFSKKADNFSGIFIHNSEYVFLDDTACNLASINLAKFINEESQQFDTEAYLHAIRLWTMVLEISVLMSQFPSAEIASNTYKFRTLGLGYANLGTLLMLWGIPYDSDKARAIAGALTAILTGEAYATSARMAEVFGPFAEFAKNREHMLRVIRNHRRAAYAEDQDKYENLTIKPVPIDPNICPADLLTTARSAWDRAMELGEKFGYRNAQVTVLAPTGTIGLLMDCDTTGIEPDFALVKFKKLAGGGYFKIVNQSAAGALRSLGYAADQINDIVRYATGTMSLSGTPHINIASLKEKGFNDEDLARIEKLLPGVFSLTMAFSTGTLGEPLLQKLNLAEKAKENPMLDVLAELGFSQEEIQAANEEICGRMTIEGAPHLREEHYPVFDCANKCGEKGTRFIAYEGHIRMLAATQPFISGSISKTINMSNEASVEEVENAYMIGWKLGLKCNAIYRDGSKLSQPLSTKSKSTKDDNKNEPCERIVEKVVEKVVERPHRVKLPRERQSVTRKVNLAGQEFYVTVGMYPDGKPGEVFITMGQGGTFASGMADAFAKVLSNALQYGVPVSNVVRQLRHMRFAPDGFTGDPDYPTASSVVDFIAQWLDKTFPDGNWKQTAQLPLPDPQEAQATISNSQFLIPNDDKLKKEAQTTNRAQGKQINIVSFGFTGDKCPQCGSMRMVQNGTCKKCMDCGETTGCS
jgi:ribonucleotide reductase alpha subunit